MNNLDEGFFKDKYESYKDKVFSILYKHFGIKLPKDLHDAEDWIRDYFVDKFSAFDCADSMRTHFRQYGVAENMKMDFETAKKILTENHYILESEGDLVDYACQVAEELGLRVVDYKTEKEFNYIPENGNTVINAGYTKNGNVYLRKDNKGNTIFYKVTTEDDVVRGLKDFIAYHSSKEYI
jgi:hypothetical protein